jgi:tripartite-type tricarboxylate transporter receptor subunit TctC
VSSNTVINTLALLQLGSLAGVKFQWVPTTSQAEAVAQAAGGHTDATLQSLPELTPLVQGGQLRLLAAAGEHRLPNFPEVKTLQEQGYKAANRVPLGFVSPAGLDPAIRDRLEATIIAVVSEPETKAQLLPCGVLPNARSGKAFKALYEEIAPTIEKAVIDAGMKRR